MKYMPSVKTDFFRWVVLISILFIDTVIFDTCINPRVVWAIVQNEYLSSMKNSCDRVNVQGKWNTHLTNNYNNNINIYKSVMFLIITFSTTKNVLKIKHDFIITVDVEVKQV